MIVVLSTFVGDISKMKELLVWMAKLGEHKEHDALICTFGDTPFDLVIELKELAGNLFREVRITTAHERRVGWPVDANVLFRTAATFIHEQWPQPFLIMEADATPMRPKWLEEIATEYALGQCKFLGHIYECSQPFLPSRLMSGIAIYPPESAKILPLLKESPRAWDVDCAEAMVRDGRHTSLVFHFWGQQNLPPTFVARKDATSPVNAMTLEDIPAPAALHHRCKDGSLIRLLERKLFPQEFKEKIVVCLPVYQGDLNLALVHAKWLQRMGKRHEYRAVICHDPSCPVVGLNQFEQMLRGVFVEVESFVYSRPPIPTYPAAANWAWQSVAMQMAKGKSPWLWFEADAIALKPDWIEQLQVEYDGCGRGWLGNIVPHLGHCQGTAIYPADAALRMPGAMSCGDGHAFDMQTKEVIHDCHDSRLMHHCWSLLNRMSHPVGGGEIPANITPAELRRWLPRESVFLHRVKDNSVLNALLTGQYVH